MQLLSSATKWTPPDDGAKDGPTGGAERCAAAMLAGLPAVMWFIRRNMRRNRGAGLSVPQFRTLCLLEKCPTASLSAVAEHLGASTPTASRMMAGLVSKGYVARKAGVADRRQMSLLLTARGRTALAASRKQTGRRIADEIRRLTDEQRSVIEGSMALLREIFDAADAAELLAMGQEKPARR